MLKELLRDRPIRKRRLAGQEIIKRAAQAVEIGADVAAARVARLLRGDEFRRPHHRADQRQMRPGPVARGVSVAGQPHVENLDHAERIVQRRLGGA